LKRLVLAGTVSLVTMLSSAVAAAETWDCAYTGKWNTTGSSDKGDFSWNLQWTSASSGWTVVGNYSDKYGNSYLDGTCTSKSCTLSQLYKSGSLNGKRYGWTGTYTDRAEGAGRTVNTFVGTWGNGASNTGGGAWTATAICVKR
jgi:hypothetical protein